jgi:hypothetical protein
MRRMPGLLIAAMLVCGAARAQGAPSAADSTAIRHVIAGQIEAFLRDDGTAAYAFAAPNIREKFGGPAQFLAMVQQAYGPVYRARSFSFGSLTPEGGMELQQVEIVGPLGETALAIYSMEREPDGNWRIAGCSLVQGKRLEI